MTTYKDIINRLEAANSVAIFMHINPDADCIGASLSVYAILKKLGKTANVFAMGGSAVIPEKLRFLPYVEAYNVEKLKKYDVSIALDCGDAGRLGDPCFRLYCTGSVKICIDHHEETSSFADLTICESDSASTTQILYKLFTQWDTKLIDKDIATLLYAGLLTDSGGFTYSCTTIETMEVGAKLLAYGFDNADIARKVMKDISYNAFLLKNRVLSKAKLFKDNKICAIVFRIEDFAETNTVEYDTDGIVNSILSIDSVEIAISIVEINRNAFKVSFRTKEKVSASACAKCFGGGGHLRAAGCRAYGIFEDVFDRIINAAIEMYDYA